MKKLIIKTCDVYEVIWYLLSDETTEVESIEVLPRARVALCQFAVSGANLEDLQEQYLKDQAFVSIKAFRKTLHQVNGLIDKARKQAKKAQLAVEPDKGGIA